MFGTFDFEMPPLMRMPAYDKKSYDEGDAWTKGDDPSTWIGEPVIAQKRVGVVGSIKKDWAMVVSFEPYSRGSFGVKPTELRRAIPKKKPHGPKLSYIRILRDAALTVSGVKKEGDAVELSIRVPPDGRALPFETETDAFELLHAPLTIKDGIVHKFRPSALSDALTADLTEREMEGAHRMRDVRPELAKKYVRSFALVGVAPYSAASLDLMSEKDAHDVLAGPWPTATLRIVATDPKWIAHLETSSYEWLALEAYPLEAPRDPAPKVEIAITRPDARAVLWFAKGTSDKIWMIERFGRTLKTRYGRRTDKKRSEKNEVLADEAAAIKAYDKAVAKKTKEGYGAPFTTAEAVASIEKRLGVVVDDASGELVVTRAGAKAELRAKDRIESFTGPDGQVHLHVVEELAITTVDVPKGTGVYLAYHRPATGIYTSASIKIG
jgi:predicted DNA-binding WGR domain protein